MDGECAGEAGGVDDGGAVLLALVWAVTIQWRASGHDAVAAVAVVFLVKTSRMPAIFLA